eukprot:1140519-Pelagomonas_calceolata.AAC.1
MIHSQPLLVVRIEKKKKRNKRCCKPELATSMRGGSLASKSEAWHCLQSERKGAARKEATFHIQDVPRSSTFLGLNSSHRALGLLVSLSDQVGCYTVVNGPRPEYLYLHVGSGAAGSSCFMLPMYHELEVEGRKGTTYYVGGLH